MNHWTDKLNIKERDAVRQRLALKARIRKMLEGGLEVEASQVMLQLRAWDREFAHDNGGVPEYRED